MSRTTCGEYNNCHGVKLGCGYCGARYYTTTTDIRYAFVDISTHTVIKDYKYTKYDGYFEVLIPYTIQKKDYPLFTFELTYSYKQFFCGVFAPISFSTQDLFTNFSFQIFYSMQLQRIKLYLMEKMNKKIYISCLLKMKE